MREKIADGSLISKWRKPGYELLCSMLAIQKNNHNFGTTSHCRVPMRKRAAQQRITPDVQTGCICCASGDGKFGGPIWWNTPLEDTEESAEQNRAVWQQGGGGQGEEAEQGGDGAGELRGRRGEGARRAEQLEAPRSCSCNQAELSSRAPPAAGPSGEAGPSRKRALEVAGGEEEIEDEDVKRRLAALKG